MTHNNYRTSTGLRVFHGINDTLLILLSCTVLLPFLNILALSFNSGADAARGGILFWPRVFSLENYAHILSDRKLINAYKITLSRTILGTVISVMITAMAAYAIKNRNLPGRKIINKYFIFTMLFSGGVIPTYMLFRSMGLLNTFWVYIFNSSIVAAWDIMVMRTFFEGISISLEESGKLDGCSDIGVFFRIIMPLSKPVLSVIALFKAVYHWNDWFSGTYFIKKPSLLPVQTVLQQMLTLQRGLVDLNAASGLDALMKNTVTGESLKMATIIVSILPIVCVYPFIQKYFVKGLMLGSVKE